ncbi:MAG: cytochrome c [Alphaproteobacteria bacterium]
MRKISARTGMVIVGALILVVGLGFAGGMIIYMDSSIDAGTRAIARGEPLYQQHCASCHGARLEGQPDWRSRKADGRLPAPPHDMSGHTWHHSDEQLFRITKHGLKPPHAPEGYESDMPAFEGVLTDAEIRAVLAFIKSRWPAHIRERQTRLGQEKSR